jgi:ribulose-phosphate 3-epimerase
MIIVPAVLSDSYEQVVHNLFLVEGLTDWVQIDLCDGSVGLEKTWLPYREKELPHGFSYEFDLMVKDWERYLPRVIALGAKRVVLHIDTMTGEEVEDALLFCKKHRVGVGLCVSNTYDLHDFIIRVKEASVVYSKIFIQVMGIRKIGAQGLPFDDTVIRRIRIIGRECKHIEIQVDGSMNPETMSLVRNAGATCAIVGSYIFKSKSIRKTIEKLVRDFR